MTRTQPAWLTFRDEYNDQRIELTTPPITLGRSSSCTIVAPWPTVSRLHARIELQHDRYVLFDEDSANGTFVNGQRLHGGHVLSTGDEVWLGSKETCYDFTDPDETLTVTVPPSLDQLLIDEQARSVLVYGVAARLSRLEFDLLVHLAREPGIVKTRASCFEAVWNQPYNPSTCDDALNACIAKLRRNLRLAAQQAGAPPPEVTTVPRVGLRLDSPATFATRAETSTSIGRTT